MPIGRCAVKTSVIFDSQPWCREHFLAEVAAVRAQYLPRG